MKIQALASETAAKESQRDLGEVNEERITEARSEQAAAEAELAVAEACLLYTSRCV